VAIHRYLRDNGRAAFVLKRDLMRGPAGKLLRTLSVDGRPLSLRQVHDFNALRPFGDQVGANAAIYAFEADTSPSFPVPAVSWTAGDGPGNYASAGAIRDGLVRSDTELVPLEGEDPTSTWIRRDAERAALGECEHEIRHGVKDDAAAVFGIDRAQLADLEGARVYPYLKSRHVVKYGLFGHDLRLVPVDRAGRDNEDELARRYPRTFEYLREHRDRLDDRASSWLDGGAFYDVFGLGEYTWADYKVVWCRLGFKPHFAVVSTVEDPDLGTKPVIPGDHFMFVGTDDRHEAHYLAALLNSAPYQRSLRDLASGGKASLSKSLVSKLALPEWPGTDRARRLAESSMDAHDAVEAFLDPYRNRADATIDLSKREYNRTTIGELTDIQARIDRLVERELADASGTVGESND
jgi:adenine-specific DNA-methyltransferase